MNTRMAHVEQMVKPPPIPPTEPSDLSELFLAARRQAWPIAICAVLGLCLGIFHYATSPREFVAVSTILIEERQIDLDQEIAAAMPTARSDSSVMNQIQILQSLTLAEEVANTLNLAESEAFHANPSSFIGGQVGVAKSWLRSLLPTPAPPEAAGASSDAAGPDRALSEAAALLRTRTQFERVGRSFVVEISYVSHDPVLATDIVNAYAEAYLADGTRANVEASSRTAEWMQTQVEQLRQAAREAAESVVAFRSETSVFDQQGQRERENRAAALNELLSTFEQRYQEIAIEGTFPVLNGRILSRALPPSNPAYPSAVQLLGAGLLLGLMGGLVVAVRREGRETGFRTAQDVVRTLNLPFLGYVPPISARMLRRSQKRLPRQPSLSPQFASKRAGQAEPATLPPDLARGGPVPPDTSHQPPLTAPLDLAVSTVAGGSSADRAFRKILTAIDPGGVPTAGRIVAVGGLNEAKSGGHLASNMAAAAARASKRTLLVDGDLMGAELSKRFDAEDGPGLLDALQGVTSRSVAGRDTTVHGMHFLPLGRSSNGRVGAPPPNLDHLDDVTAALRPHYDLVFIALPPMNLLPETKRLVHVADHTIVVTRWGAMPRQLVATYLANEPDIRNRVLGVVLTETDLRRLPRYGVPLSTAELVPA